MSNVNCIRKNNTDYMYEDTAGRSLIGTEQDQSLVAVQNYAVGDLFWYNDLLYKAKVVIASGSTITLATDAEQTTVSAELDARVKTANIHHTYTSTDRNPISGEGVADALSSFSTTLDGLDDVNIDSTTLAQNQALVYDGTDWVNGKGGHVMKPDPTSNPDEDDVVTWVKGAANNNDQVASLYGVQNWSNAEITTLVAHISSGDDTVGTWEESPIDWKTSGVRTGWVWHECLYDIVSDNEVEISIDFDVSGEEVVGLYAYRVDDSVTQTIGGQTVNGGAIAIKLTSTIQNANGVDVAINLKRQRTNLVTNPTILS